MFTSAQTVTGSTPNLERASSVVRCGSDYQHVANAPLRPLPQDRVLIFEQYY
jgi:hypothetical protein